MRAKRGPVVLCVALCAALSLLTHCADDGGGASSGDAPVSDAVGDASPNADTVAGACESAAGEVDLSGTWAQLIVHTAFVELPVIGEQKKQTRAIFLTTLAQDGPTGTAGSADVTITATVCALEIDNGTDLVQTLVPDAFLASLPVQDRRGRLEAGDARLRFVQERYVEVRGAQLANPDTDPLPTGPGEATVWDQDGDGNPGVTLVSTGIVDGVMYVVQRSGDTLESACVQADRVEGLSDWTDEQVILEADNPMLLSDRPTRPAPPEDSTFVMVRLSDDDAADCESVLARRDELF